MNTHVKPRIIGLVVVLLIGAFAVWHFSKDEDAPPHLAEMHLEVNGDDADYCANFVADEVARDQIKVTITNCGETAIKVKHGRTRTKVASDGEYKSVLPPGVDKFRAVITSTKGEFIGQFNL